MLKNRYSEKLKKKVLLSLLDVLILQLVKEKLMSGPDIIKQIDKEFDILISTGTVYPVLDRLKYQKLIKNKGKNKRRLFSITKAGNNVRVLLTKHYLNIKKDLHPYLKK
ncbi:MAG: PadR family transcriptional regulator [Nanoarchaeota archaeon]|nr:PadR family transcriptional regulator [Nanoarchaeota archaeon]